jgi:DNA-binding NarL/FixJ family response regulator
MSQDLTVQDQLKILVVDDHEAMIKSTVQAVKEKYPQATFYTAMTAEETIIKLDSFKPHLIILDLQIPEKNGVETVIKTGIDLLENLLDNQNSELNIVVLSQNLKALVLLKDKINNYNGGGFLTNNKNSIDELLKKVALALDGITHTKDIPGFREKRLTIKPEWLQVLESAWDEELTDEAIAKKMNISLRTVRNYWGKIQDILEVYPEVNINLRIRTIKRAIEKRFINVN